MIYTRCPKCGHKPLPQDQTSPASCPSCGVILAKVAQRYFANSDEVLADKKSPKRRSAAIETEEMEGEFPTWKDMLLNAKPDFDPVFFWFFVGMWVLFGVWGLSLIALDYRTGAMGTSFIHGPLLVFHEAGHVIFRLFGEWPMMLGGTLGQLLMPAILVGALLIKNRDPFGASIGLWFLGVSLLDIAPYMYDALHPQLMLLSGTTGEDGGHDWIYLFNSAGVLARAQSIGGFTHKLGALVVLISIAWGGLVLWLQYAQQPGDN